MTGYEVCNRIKANPTTRGIPVVHLSASFVTSESRVMSLEGGADAYLTQPVEPPVLLATVKALLRLRKAEAMSRLSARQWQVTFDSLSEAHWIARRARPHSALQSRDVGVDPQTLFGNRRADASRNSGGSLRINLPANEQ